jgi:predicted alpha/beta-hydrolase family hydrolase
VPTDARSAGGEPPRGLVPARMSAPRPLLLFAPGAGAPSSSPWMASWARRLEALGEVVRFDYPYVLAGRRSPDRLPVLVAAHRAALAAARARTTGPVVLVGKSMGSRIGCHVALEEPVAALVCLGYPLQGARGELRSDVLLALRTPVLFVQGSRDRLCPPEALAGVRRQMMAPSFLHLVEGGDHSLRLGARALHERRVTQERVDDDALAAVASFLGHEARPGVGAGAPGRP